jgi:O-methyltransferase
MDKQLRQMAAKLESAGWGVVPADRFRIDMEPEFGRIWEKAAPYTMTSMERGYGLYKAVEYIVNRKIPGAFVECGVWKGGSCMVMAKTLLRLHADRPIYLYDTFTGMPKPTEEDRIAWNDRPVLEKWEEDQRGEKDNFGSWAVGRQEVEKNLQTTGYPHHLLRFVEGDVAKTLRQTIPEQIALLRLDTDWYASTRVELELLYPRLQTGGVLVIDDYGHFTGARRAVDEYFQENGGVPLLSRLDYTGRMGVKT